MDGAREGVGYRDTYPTNVWKVILTKLAYMRFLSEHDGLGDHVNAADDDGALNLDARPQSLELLRYLDINEKSGDILNEFTGICVTIMY